MKKSTILCGALGLLALCFTACSQDISPDQTQAKAEFDQTQYIAVQISAPRDVTRAFGNGATNESLIKTLDFFFYDVAGNPTAQPIQMSNNDINTAIEKGEASFTANPDGNNITRIFTSVVPAKLTQGQNLPSQVICIVNGTQTALDNLANVSLAALIDKERESFRTDETFVMTNSVYYGQDVLTGRAEQRLCATPINANTQLFGTEALALEASKSASDGAIVDIYVERLAAKVGVSMGANAVSAYNLTNSTGSTIDITFEPQYWSMNATDKKVYLTKRYGVETTVGEESTINPLPNFTQINSALVAGGFTNWNDETNHRSYWGCSPSYFGDNYPDVSDDVTEIINPEEEYASYYYSYNDIVNEAAKSSIGAQAIKATNKAFTTFTTTTEEGETTCSGYVYTRETTVAKQRINDVAKGNPAAAVASVVLVGKYTVPEGTETDADGTFYIDRNAGTNGTFYGTTNTAKAKLVSRQSIVFTSNDGAVGTRAGEGRFVLAHPTKAVREIAGTKLSGRLVTIQITAETLTGDAIYYYKLNQDGTGNYVQVSTENLNEVNAQLLSVGYMDMFAQGMAFFSIPIRHLNWKDAYYTNGTYDWAAMQSGSLGVVRNHVYNLTISSVKGLGTALRSADQPIVPAKEEANQYIAARLNILAWNIANEWSVDL